MDYELDLLLGTAVDSPAKLAILLHLHAYSAEVFLPEELASAITRKIEVVQEALGQLTEAGLVKRFAVATGRHAHYGAREDERLQALIGRLQERCEEGGESWGVLMRRVMRTENEVQR